MAFLFPLRGVGRGVKRRYGRLGLGGPRCATTATHRAERGEHFGGIWIPDE